MCSTENFPAPQSSSPPATDGDLRSPAGIRWLLFVGALVVAASLVRLTAAEWAAMSPHLKAIILIGGSLMVYGLGEVTRYRLRLPVAGSALLGLFAAIVPLLAWGAAYRQLLDVPLGWVTVLVGFAALLAACRRLLRLEMDVSGPVYPLALAILMLAVPVLPWLAPGFPRSVMPTLAILALGLVLRAGSRHINRFLFHRDRVAGRDRPLHLLPFAMLATLFAATALLLVPIGAWLALPLVILGLALVDTGEEYYRALVAAEGRVALLWPLRSRALLACGFAAMAAGIGLALFGAQALTLLLVALIVALRLAFWALRYQKPVAYGVALGAGILAWHELRTLVPGLEESLVSLSWWHLGAVGVLVALAGIASRRRGVLSPAQWSLHAAVTAILALAVLLVALLEASTLLWIAPLMAGLLGLAFLTTRRALLLPVLFLALEGLVYAAYVVSALHHDLELANLAQLMVVLCTVFVLLGGFLKDRLKGSWLDTDAVERALVYPPLLLAVTLAILAPVLGGAAASSGIVLATAIILALSARRLALPPLFEGAVLALWSGVHLFAWSLGGDGYSSWTAVAGQLLFVTFWGLLRHSAEDRPWAGAVRLGLWLAGMSAFGGLFLAVANDSFASEPLSLLLVGAFGIDRLRRGEAPEGRALLGLRAAALGMVVLYAPLQVLVLDWVSRPELLWLVAGAALSVLRLGGRRIAGRRSAGRRSATTDVLDVLEGVWLGFAVLACLLFAGPAALLLAAGATAVALWRRARLRPSRDLLWAISLLPVLQGVVWMFSEHRLLWVALFEDGYILLPWIVAVSWLWQMAIDRWLPHVRSRVFSLSLDATIASAMLIFWLGGAATTTPLHLLLFLAALGRAGRQLVLGTMGREAWGGWLFQGWIALAWLVAFNAGWLSFGGLYAGYALMLGAVAEVALGELLERRGQNVLAAPTVPIAFALALIAGAASLVAAWTVGSAVSPWLTLFPVFLASLYFLWMALFDHVRPLAAVLSCGSFAIALLALFVRLGDVPGELYWLGPGIALVMLSRLLVRELGQTWSQWIFSAGALCFYAMPVMGLLAGLTWGWQIILALFAIAFGAVSFRLRSQSLLVLSTAALLLDLTFFVFKLHQEAPLLIWVFGVVLGLGLMSVAALFEYRREQLLQQFRLWGREIRAWS